jgi:hypothetical protein
MRRSAKRRYSVVVDEPKTQFATAGLCATCMHMRQITSDRGSLFYQCQLSAVDASFPKYPRLPVIQCRGYQNVECRP